MTNDVVERIAQDAERFNRVSQSLNLARCAAILNTLRRDRPYVLGSAYCHFPVFCRRARWPFSGRAYLAKAGGLLLAGLDPTGIGGVVAGFSDQREVELLVEAGFTPLEAIHIATANGAEFLGEADRIGTIMVGKQADLVVIKGDPSTRIEDIENVEMVFKDGVGYDSAKLIDSVRGMVGSR